MFIQYEAKAQEHIILGAHSSVGRDSAAPLTCDTMSLCAWFPAFQRVTVPLSQPALGWLRSVKECQKGTKTFLVLPYMAISWQLVTSGWRKVGGENYQTFHS